MKVPQVSVFLENRRGRLKEACKVLADAGVNLIALTLADTADFGVMRFIVSDPHVAVRALKENGFTAIVNEVLAIEVPDRPGGLASVLEVLHDGGIGIEYIYAFRQQPGKPAILIFRFDRPDEAIEILQKAGVNVLRKVDLLSAGS